MRTNLQHVTWRSFIPSCGVVEALRLYSGNKDLIVADASAGLVVAIMLIPQALAYAVLAGMPAVTGFYAAILALVAYPLFGTSPFQAVGPVAIMSLLSKEAVTEALAEAGAADSAAAAIAMSAKLAFLIGIVQLAMGAMKAGYLINFLSHPVLAGFTAASAVIIATSQLPKALGLTVPTTAYAWQTWAEVATRLPRTHGPSVALFAANMVLFHVLTGLRQRVLGSGAVKARPWLKALLRLVSVALVVVTANILLVWLAGLKGKGVRVLGDVPAGLPTFMPASVFDGFPRDAGHLLPSALLISLITYVESASVAKSMAAKWGLPPGAAPMDGSQELLGLGLANVASALFGGFPVTGGFSRSGVQAEAGARTVMTGLVAGAVLTLVASTLAPAFYYLPDVCLAALITFSALRLLESHTLRFLLAVDKADAGVYMLTAAVILGAGIENGLLVGAAASVLRLVQEAAVPHTAVLGRMPDGATYRKRGALPRRGAAAAGPAHRTPGRPAVLCKRAAVGGRGAARRCSQPCVPAGERGCGGRLRGGRGRPARSASGFLSRALHRLLGRARPDRGAAHRVGQGARAGACGWRRRVGGGCTFAVALSSARVRGVRARAGARQAQAGTACSPSGCSTCRRSGRGGRLCAPRGAAGT